MQTWRCKPAFGPVQACVYSLYGLNGWAQKLFTPSFIFMSGGRIATQQGNMFVWILWMYKNNINSQLRCCGQFTLFERKTNWTTAPSAKLWENRWIYTAYYFISGPLWKSIEVKMQSSCVQLWLYRCSSYLWSVCMSVYLYGGVVPAPFYRNHVSRFDVEAGQVVVVAIIFKGSNLQSCWSIWRTRTGGKSDRGDNESLAVV